MMQNPVRKQIEEKLENNDLSLHDLNKCIREFENLQENHPDLWSIVALSPEECRNFAAQKDLERKRELLERIPPNSRELFEFLES